MVKIRCLVLNKFECFRGHDEQLVLALLEAETRVITSRIDIDNRTVSSTMKLVVAITKATMIAASIKGYHAPILHGGHAQHQL